MRRIFLVSPGLVDLHSHYFGDAFGWLEACRAKGIELRLYIGASALPQIVERLGAKPIFPFPSDAIIERDLATRHLADFITLGVAYGEACRALEADGIGGGDVVMSPFSTHRDVFGTALWLERLPPEARPSCVFQFHLPDDTWSIDAQRKQVTGDISCFRYAVRRILNSLPPQKLIIGAVDPRLREAIERVAGFFCDPLPVGIHFVSDEALVGGEMPPQAHVRIAGEFRPEKGSLLVPQIINRFSALRPGKSFGVQVNDQASATALAQLLGPCLSPVNIRLGHLSREDHQRQLICTDILLLPYRWDRYAMRHSGLFTEAAGLGIVVVGPERTWIGDRLAAGMGAGVTFREFSVDAIVEALLEASDRYADLKARALRRKDFWRSTNATPALLDAVLRRLAH